jgi:thiol-disulfide isomerase/thioredoxin
MRFKPTFEALAKENKNSNIVFCAVETDKARDAAQANNVTSIP